LTHPSASKTSVLKEIALDGGTIGFSFAKFEPGYDYGTTANMVLRVYRGRGAAKTLLWTFGREDAGYTRPSGSYSIDGNEATFEYYSGNQWGTRRGWTLDYWQE
jgi:hypothetical protein